MESLEGISGHSLDRCREDLDYRSPSRAAVPTSAETVDSDDTWTRSPFDRTHRTKSTRTYRRAPQRSSTANTDLHVDPEVSNDRLRTVDETIAVVGDHHVNDLER